MGDFSRWLGRMYNLLMSGLDTAFDGSTWELERGRLGEYTDPEIVKRFERLDDESLSLLKSLPTLFWYERSNENGARLGWLDEVRRVGGNVVVQFAFDPSVQEIPFANIIDLAPALGIQLGSRQLEGHRTHWAVKDVDLLDVLDRAKLMKRASVSPYAPYVGSQTKYQNPGILVRPQFFEIPAQPIDRKLVSVMMPFKSSFDPVYSAITNAANKAGMHTQRADNIWEHSVLMQDLFSLIYRSHVVVCDFSEKNPNVFYEAGIAHMLGRHVVPITQSHDDVPFDLRQHRYLHYLNNGEGLAGLTGQLAARLTTLARS